MAGSPYIISPTLSPTAVLSNYDVTYNTANFTINKANATCIVNGYTGTYDSAAHGATGSCTGVAGMSDVLTGLSIAPTTYTNVPGGLCSGVLQTTTTWTRAHPRRLQSSRLLKRLR